MANTEGTPEALALGGYFRILFDAVPSPILIVDDDVRILDYNVAGAGLLGQDRKLQYMKRGGDALHCVHSYESPEGCGRADHCRDCIIRNSVSEALRDGKPCRRRTMVELMDIPAKTRKELMLLVTASPFRYDGKNLVLLVLDDVSELMRMQKILPICSHCKKIRNDANYWKSVEEYFLEHENLLFSHSVCNECAEKYYPPPPSRNR
ncbi:MAG: PAS domain-containing protein [bacterium]|nr:PAS domain-containing protein [bacterium]